MLALSNKNFFDKEVETMMTKRFNFEKISTETISKIIIFNSTYLHKCKYNLICHGNLYIIHMYLRLLQQSEIMVCQGVIYLRQH